jgi:membrane fusion protein, multidrug efflux system
MSRPAVGLGLVIAALFLGAACGHAPEPSAAPAAAPAGSPPPRIAVAKVVRQRLDIKVRLPGELEPYEVVSVYPKVTGFLQWIGVDRGSVVKRDRVIARLEAPELVAQRAEAESKLLSIQSQRVAAQAKLAADESTYEKLRVAAQTPGVVAGNDLVIAEKAAEADRAQVKAFEDNVAAARQALRAIAEIEGYLQIAAPFDGVVTERNTHPGALVGPAGGPGGKTPLVRIETLARLRLVVPVPETYVARIPEGTRVSFTVPAFPSVTFAAPVARVAHSLDVKTRTMPVELDVANPEGHLSPGTFSEVLWPVSRPEPTLFVPPSAVARTTERTFVLAIRQEKVEWVDVKIGAQSGPLIEVFGDLQEGEMLALRGTDELRPGTRVMPQAAPAEIAK